MDFWDSVCSDPECLLWSVFFSVFFSGCDSDPGSNASPADFTSVSSVFLHHLTDFSVFTSDAEKKDIKMRLNQI